MASASPRSQLLAADDQETLCRLYDNDIDNQDSNDLPSRLVGVADRFWQDCATARSTAHWAKVLGAAASLGFAGSSLPSNTTNTTSTSTSTSYTVEDSWLESDWPQAFRSADGQVHVEAVASLLGLTKSRALQLTVQAVRTLPTSQPKFQNLTGTLTLVLKVIDHHYQQKVARLSIVAECLRMEQDTTTVTATHTADRAAVVQLLDELDENDGSSTSSSHGSSDPKRGLFRWLVSIATQPDATLDRERLLPARKLRTAAADTGTSAATTTTTINTNERAWQQFLGDVTEMQRSYALQERVAALEALLVLLYDRLEAGVRRVDLACLLLAFEGCGAFFTNAGNPLLSHTAALITAECMSLSKISFTAASGDTALPVDWVSSHPLLLGLLENSNGGVAARELEALTSLLFRFAGQVVDRKVQRWSAVKHKMDATTNNAVMVVETPESLAILSFGLLLLLTYSSTLESFQGGTTDAYWQTFGSTGMELAKIASDDCDAFDYLHLVMESVVGTAHRVPGLDESSGGSAEDSDLSAASITYASIGCELLTAAVSAFQDTILSVHHAAAPENVGMLCNLTAVIFCNSTLLCEPFWADWQSYITSRSGPSPLCLLMDSALKLASFAKSPGKSAEDSLRAVSPLLRLAASLAYSAELVEAIIVSLFPPDLIKNTISLCYASARPVQSEEFVKCRETVLDSLCTLTSVGNSSSCRQCMRSLLGDSVNVGGRGPRMLLQFVAACHYDTIGKKVFLLLSELLTDAPEEWVLELAEALASMKEGSDTQRGARARPIFETQSAVKLVDGLVSNMTRVLFSSSVKEEAANGFLSLLASEVLSMGALLSSSLSTTSMQLDGSGSLSYGTATIILNSISNTLNQILPIMELHESNSLRKVAEELRYSLINALMMSKGLGETVYYYAVAPVSLCTLQSLDDWIQNASVLRLMSTSDSTDKSTRFTSLRANHGASLTENTSRDARTYLIENLLASTESVSLDIEAVRARGWLSENDAQAPFRASVSAFRLLTCWAEHAEDLTKQGSDRQEEDAVFELSSLSPYRLLLTRAMVPQSVRSSSALLSCWMSANVSNFSLMVRYLGISDETISASLSTHALDFARVCCQHATKSQAVEGTADDMLFSAVYHSVPFHQTIESTVQRAQRLAESTDAGDANESDLGLGLRGLRLLAACMEMGSSIASKLMKVTDPSIFANLADVVTLILGSLHGSSDGMTLNKLKIAEACSQVLRSVWRYARMPPSGGNGIEADNLKTTVEKEKRLLSQLASFIFNSPLSFDTADKNDTLTQQSRGILLSLKSIVLDILTIEIDWARSRDRISSELSVVQALESAMEQDLSRLVALSKQFMTTHGLLAFAETHGTVATYFRKIDRVSLPSSGIPIRLITAPNPDPLRAVPTNGGILSLPESLWLASLPNGSEEASGELGNYAKLMLSYKVLSKELDCLSAWRYFSEIISVLLKKWRRQSSGAAILSMPDGTFSISMALETLRGLHENIGYVELAHLKAPFELLRDETLKLASASAALLLTFTFRAEDSAFVMSTEDWIEALGLVSQSTKKFLGILREHTMVRNDHGNPHRACLILEKMTYTRLVLQSSPIILQQLLASARAISMTRTDTASLSYEAKNRSDGIHVELATTACKVVRALESWATSSQKATEERRKYRSCFFTCVSLLTSLFINDDSPLEGQRSYILKLHSTLSEFDTIRSLVFHASLASTPVARLTNNFASNAGPAATWDEGESALVLSVLDLFTAIAAGGDSSMLSLLVEGKASLVVLRNPILTSWQESHSTISPFPLRGYIPEGARTHQQTALSTGTTAMYAGLDDPTHTLWRASLKFIASTLRSASRNADTRDGTMSRYCTVAFDFLLSNRESVLSALRTCSSVSFGSKSFVFTLNALREATLIISILSELTSRAHVDAFKRACQELYSDLIREAKSLVVSIGSFLGASGSSRELFRAMADFDTGDGLPVYHVISGGVPNAKHEAIRYSHFVSRCSAAVTREDHESQSTFPPQWEHTLRRGSISDPHSVSSLEHNCRSSVTSNFAFKVEHAAAECLFFALSTVWKSHPASTSFVMFSEQEASRLDALPLVRPGMIIAFRAADGGEFLSTSEKDSPGSMYFGQVLHCDTVHRAWNVGLMNGPSSDGAATCFVSESQLAGIEDTNKRRCILSFVPAPESSSELEGMGASISVGHLLLVLRWCSQMSLEARGDESRRGVESLASRLAELTTAVLGTELSIHHEIGSQHSTMTPEAEKILAAQLLDLFGETSELGFEEAFGPAAARHGRLKSVVDDSVWQAVRRQILNELDRAITDIQAKRNGKNMSAIEGGWYTGMRSSGNASPFRGLGM